MTDEHSANESIYENNYVVKDEPEKDILAISPRSATVSVDMLSLMNGEEPIEYKPNRPGVGSPGCDDNYGSHDEHSVEYLEEENPISE